MRGSKIDNGEQPTFDELFRDYGARVYGYCWRLSNGNEAEAEDLTQETFIRAYRGLNQFEGRSSVLTWLFQIARREWIRAYRRKEETLSLEATGVEEPLHDPMPGRLTQLWINAALQRLPDQLREALILVKSEGLTYREAAEVLEVPQGTVQFHVHQAMKQMRGLLAEQTGLPVVLGIVVALYLQKSLRAEVKAPRGLSQKIYGAIGRSVPPTETVPTAPAARRPNRARLGAALLMMVMTLGLGVTSLVLLGQFSRVFPSAPPGPRTRLAETLRNLSRVQTAHANGELTIHQLTVRGTSEQQKSAMEYWFKPPRKYLVTQRRFGRLVHRLVIENGTGTMRVSRPNGDILIPHNAARSAQELAGFGLFTNDGELPRRQSEAQVALVATDGGYGASELISAELSSDRSRQRWLIFLGADSARPVRVEYSSDRLEGANWRRTSDLILDNLEYDLGVPDSLFDLSRSE